MGIGGIADFRLPDNALSNNKLYDRWKSRAGSFNEKQRGFRRKPGGHGHEFHEFSRILFSINS